MTKVFIYHKPKSTSLQRRNGGTECMFTVLRHCYSCTQLWAQTCKLAMVWYHQKSREVMK